MGRVTPFAIASGTRVLLDTATLIYFLQTHTRHGAAAQDVLRAIEQGHLRGFLASVALTELLVPLCKAGETRQATLLVNRLEMIPNLRIVPADTDIAVMAARLRGRYNLRSPDALHAATALAVQAGGIITNDRDFLPLREDGLNIWLFDELG